MASRSLKRFGVLAGIGGLVGISYYYNTRNPFEESCGKFPVQVQGHAKTGHADDRDKSDEAAEEERISRREKIAKSKFDNCQCHKVIQWYYGYPGFPKPWQLNSINQFFDLVFVIRSASCCVQS